MNRINVGADISKKNFDVAFMNSNGKWSNSKFSNDQDGFDKFKTWLEKNNLPCITLAMESTGHYGDELAHYMYNIGCKIFMINPAQVKYYAQSKLARAKTDKVDARLIAEFATKNPDLRSWVPKTKSLQKHCELYHCLQNLTDDRARFMNRLEAARDDDVRSTIISHIDYLTKSIDEVERKIKIVISEDDNLRKNDFLLQSIKGIGRKTSWGVLAETPDISNFKNPKQLAAFAGLNPSLRESGSSVRGTGVISKMGNAALRKLLFLPAITAIRCNPVIKEFADRVYKKSMKKKVAIVASMRKLLHIIFGVLSKGNPFKISILPC